MPVRNLALLVSLCANLVALGSLTLLLAKRGGAAKEVPADTAASAAPRPAAESAEPVCPPPPPATPCPEPVCPVPAPPVCSVGALDPAGLPRFSVCDDARSAVQVSALGGQQLAVHCGSSVHVLALDATTGPRRTLRIDKPARAPKQHWSSGPVRMGDISGDGLPDLLVGFAAADETDAPRGGALVELVQTAGGGYAPPHTLAPLTVADLALGRFSDDSLGADIAVLQREDTRVGRSNELLVMRGGPAPLKAAGIKLPDNARRLVAVDLDLDGRAELITTGDAPNAELFHLGPHAELLRRESIGLPSAAELVVADFNADDHDDVLFVPRDLVRPAQLSGLMASTSEQTLRTLAAAFDLTHLQRVEADLSGESKGKPTLLGTRGGELYSVRFDSSQTMTVDKLSALPKLTPHAFVGLSASAGQAYGSWLAVFAADPEPSDVIDVIVTKVSDIQRGVRWSQTRAPLPDAPLSLRWTIP